MSNITMGQIVSSIAIITAISGKQDTLTFEYTNA